MKRVILESDIVLKSWVLLKVDVSLAGEISVNGLCLQGEVSFLCD